MRSFVLSANIAVWISIGACRDHGIQSKEDIKQDTLYSGSNFNDHIRVTSARTPDEERAGFNLPEGFDIQLYAAEPDIGKPINFNFDEKGRMWVTQSFEYPFPAIPGHGRDRLTIVEDTDHDGRADTFTHITDTLNIPIGVMPVEYGAIVYSIPDITRYSAGSADSGALNSKKLLGPFEHKDTHGMVNNLTRGFDGWIHACHGYTNQSEIKGKDGKGVRLVSGSTFRFREDGSKIEQETAGRINPFGLAYDELGYLYSTDCHTSPLYQLIQGGDYPQSGKEEGIGFAPDMKPFDNEATALAGLAYYADTCFPAFYRRNLFIGDAVTSRVYRNSFTWKGSTPVGKKEADFIKSSDPWFRPVAVQMGPDGALYIADFYNSIIGHYEVPLNHPKRDKIRGRIWRVTYNGQTNKNQNWRGATINTLVGSLNHSNLAARIQISEEIFRRGPEQGLARVLDLLNSTSTPAQVHALWLIQRWGKLSDSLISNLAHSPRMEIRLHILRAIKEQQSCREFIQKLAYEALGDSSAHVKRAAVEVLGIFPTMATLKTLTSFLDNIDTSDTHLLYTTRLTIRKILERTTELTEIGRQRWTSSEFRWLAGIMIGVSRTESGTFLLNYLQQHGHSGENTGRFLRHALRWVPASSLDSVVAIGRRQIAKHPHLEVNIYGSLQSGFEERGQAPGRMFQQWGQALSRKILKDETGNPSARRDLPALYFAASTAARYRLTDTYLPLTNFFGDSTLPLDARLVILRAMFTLAPDSIGPAAVAILNDSTTSSEFKRWTLTVMADFPTKEVSDAAAGIKNPEPDLQWWIVMVLASSPYGQELLLAKAKSGEVPARLLTEPMIAERLALRQSAAYKSAFAAITKRVVGAEKEKEQIIAKRIADYNAMNPKPMASDGRMVFQKNCSPCHSIKGQGGKVGPQLDGVGKWGATSLVEKVLDPNRNVSENFINYTLTLRSGQVTSGLFRRVEGAVEVYVNLAGKEFTVATADIVKKTKAAYTLMPDQFRNTISEIDFGSLLSYLLSQQSGD